MAQYDPKTGMWWSKETGYTSTRPAAAAATAKSSAATATTSTAAYKTPEEIMADYELKALEAKTSNESRYADILSQWDTTSESAQSKWAEQMALVSKAYQDRLATAMGYLEGAGTQQAADINQSAASQGSQMRQDLVSRGLTGSGILPSMYQGVERERTAAQNRLSESLNQQRLGAYGELSGDALGAQLSGEQFGQSLATQYATSKLGFMERREDPYPSLSDYIEMMKMSGDVAAKEKADSPAGIQAEIDKQTKIAEATKKATTKTLVRQVTSGGITKQYWSDGTITTTGTPTQTFAEKAKAAK